MAHSPQDKTPLLAIGNKTEYPIARQRHFGLSVDNKTFVSQISKNSGKPIYYSKTFLIFARHKHDKDCLLTASFHYNGSNRLVTLFTTYKPTFFQQIINPLKFTEHYEKDKLIPDDDGTDVVVCIWLQATDP